MHMKGSAGTIVAGGRRLDDWTPRHPHFVAVDSDGCVFDTMEVKQRRCFHPLIESHWRLRKVRKELGKCAEFVTLYSRLRGSNRFIGLLAIMDLLREMPAVEKAGAALPRFESLRRFVESGVPLGNDQLAAAVKSSGDRELAAVLAWSRAVDARVARTIGKPAPFKLAVAGLELLAGKADLVVVSQTSTETVVREWTARGIAGLARKIAGQESGNKSEQIRLAAAGRYAPENMLVIGDSPGDLKAAQDNLAGFYPIAPGSENASWRRFRDETAGMFLTGRYEGTYRQEIVDRFNALLPENPPWKKAGAGSAARKGYVHIYTGDGKGKTSAAMGLVVRAAGAGLRVYVCQFAKSRDSGEITALRERFPEVVIDRFGSGGFIRGAPTAGQKALSAAGLRKLGDELRSGRYDVVVADELCWAASIGLCDGSAVAELVKNRPPAVELVLTGRDCDRSLVRMADIVTAMKKVKHYYDHGVKARKGIEW